nr:ankyrin repeat-containing protein [Tanacetum cinerariifolium]GEX97012.1 ankyrin repeat-containing protein [Tanacetum cinerariifolium]
MDRECNRERVGRMESEFFIWRMQNWCLFVLRLEDDVPDIPIGGQNSLGRAKAESSSKLIESSELSLELEPRVKDYEINV